MATDKEIKKEFKKKASESPDKYYATTVLKEEGFERKRCKCGTYFWTVNKDQDHCGDPSCSGGFRFINQKLAKEEMDYIQVWQRFAEHFRKRGYTPIPRYPVVARWRDDTDFVQASIYDFQPYVVSGEVKPPANPLVVPQFCVRFNDIDNVGITGAHYTGFVMIGQHAFNTPEEWDQEKYFRDIHSWLKDGLGLPNSEITFHEDAWAGGGNFGPCMEYFSRGLELGNQVYMMFEQTPTGAKELKLKVLDMGMGHERNAWFTKGTSTSYETTFPTVCKMLYERTGIKIDNALMTKFLPLSSFLNVDEVEDINETWKEVAEKIGMDVDELKEKILPLAALYSIAEHTRSLLFALSDGALPSNTGGGYNLRVILRRALGFIDKYKWDIGLGEVAEEHAKYLKPIFPELMENLTEVKKILEVEKKKYENLKEKSKAIVDRIVKEKKVSNEKLIELYDSNGISPEIITEEAEKAGVKIKVPDDFYTKVAERHEKQEQEHATVREEKLDLAGIEDTDALYFDDYKDIEFVAKVLKVIDKDVVLDRTAFYPTSGGQIHDIGIISGDDVKDVFKQGAVIIHRMKDKPKFKAGDEVTGEVDIQRRKQLAIHHTATHVVNAAARAVLGKHINQAGAKKTLEKATLDITHYESVSDEEMKRIEEEANKIVKAEKNVSKSFMGRDEAEKKYGMSIYQGGAVPGNKLRIVEIEGIDVECCAGTHLDNTKEIGKIKLLKSTKISDGIVRLTYTAGDAMEKEKVGQQSILTEAAVLLGVKEDEVPGRANELFSKWKEARKAVKKKKEIDMKKLELVSGDKFSGDALAETAKILQTQPEHVIKTISRFMDELKKFKLELKK